MVNQVRLSHYGQLDNAQSSFYLGTKVTVDT
jgi:hypothetical protein